MDYVIGEFTYNIDAKGRIVMPNKFRSFLGDVFIVTRGLDGCLFVFPEKEWQQFESKLSGLPMTSKEARSFTRFFFAGACECTPDKQGRVMLPANLRQFARLDKTAVVVGLNNRIEIWNEAAWAENTAIDPEDVAEHMAAL